MQQASDFLAESEALEQLIAPLQASDFAHPTGFKSWTFETIMRHLHFWNHMANLALTAPDAFQAALKPAVEAMMAGKTLPDIELAKFPEGGSNWCLSGKPDFARWPRPTSRPTLPIVFLGSVPA